MKECFQNNTTLIRHLKKGNMKAYSFLVDSFHHELCVYAINLANDKAMAEDIVQNVFIKIWERRKTLKENFTLLNFLYKSVYNEFVDQYRKKQSALVLEKKYVETVDKLIEEKEDKSTEILIDMVMTAIQDLSPKCKQIILLSKKEGLTNIEIATYLNTSVKSVEGHITKAYTKIREKVGNKIKIILFLLFKPNKYGNKFCSHSHK